MLLPHPQERRLRTLAVILTVGFVAAVPFIIAPLNFILRGNSSIGFYFVAILAPCVLFLLYWGVLWKVCLRKETHQLRISSRFSSLPNGLALASLFGGVIAFFSTGLLFQNGFDALLPTMSLVGGLIIFSCVFGSEACSSEAKTIPEFLGLRFGRTVHTVTFFISIFSTFGLLLVIFAVYSALVSGFFSLPPVAVSGLIAVVVGFLVGNSGLRSAVRISAALYSFFTLYIFAFLASLAFDNFGSVLPQMGLLPALKDVSSAEITLIEKGAVDFGLFKPFLKEFLTVDRGNWVLIGLCSLASLSVLPSLYQISASLRSYSERCKSISWAIFFVVLTLTALPLAAALYRLEVYRCITQETSFSDLPRWIILASERDLLRIHGVSLSLVKNVTSLVRGGAQSLKEVEGAIVSTGMQQSQNWHRLDENVHKVLFEVAQKNSLDPLSSTDQLKKDFLHLVLPVAAKASGNFSEKITYSALSMHSSGILLALPDLLSQSVFLRALMVLSLMGVGFGCLASLTATLATQIIYDGSNLFLHQKSFPESTLKPIRSWSIFMLALTALLATTVRIPYAFLVVGCLSLLAVSLFPAVILRGCGTRANAIGCLAGMGVGVGVFIYYFLGTSIFSVPFYEKWFWLSNGGLEGYAEFKELKSSWVGAEGEARAALFRDLHLLTSGSLWSPGLANWFGIAPASSAIISIPLATLSGFIVSLLTHRPTFLKREAT